MTNLETRISALEGFFRDRELPAGPIKIRAGETIANPRLFVDSTLMHLKARIRSDFITGVVAHYVNTELGRLEKLKSILTNPPRA